MDLLFSIESQIVPLALDKVSKKTGLSWIRVVDENAELATSWVRRGGPILTRFLSGQVQRECIDSKPHESCRLHMEAVKASDRARSTCVVVARFTACIHQMPEYLQPIASKIAMLVLLDMMSPHMSEPMNGVCWDYIGLIVSKRSQTNSLH